MSDSTPSDKANGDTVFDERKGRKTRNLAEEFEKLLAEQRMVQEAYGVLPVLNDAETPSQDQLGRPQIEGVLAAYHESYPDGRKAAGASWKTAARKVSERIGETVSPDTLKRRLGLKR